MTEFFISYAQNYEDVYLWRALRHVDRGCYLDVGAYDPDIDSVTRAFYERGWRGVNLEPATEYYEKLCRIRSEDINLNMAAGSKEGVMMLYEVPGTGLSTPVYDNALRVQNDGRSFNARDVPVITLNKVWEDSLLNTVHFLKIDVEGGEEAVLRGLDLSKYRPWIIVVESMIPNSPEESFASWEPILLSGEYGFAVFDGLNRYYVAKEHSDLRAKLSTPPNFFDYFVRAGEFEARQVRERLSQIECEREALQARMEKVQCDNVVLQKTSERLHETLGTLYRSRSWRYTAPLRAVTRRLSQIVRIFREAGR